MSTPHGPERRAQALRRSGAAGIHDDRPTRTEAVRAALADQGVTEEVTMSTHPTDDPREAAVAALAPYELVPPFSAVRIIEAAGLRVVWADPPETGGLAEVEQAFARQGLVQVADELETLATQLEPSQPGAARQMGRRAFLVRAHRCAPPAAEDPEAAEEVVVARDTARGTGPTVGADGPA